MRTVYEEIHRSGIIPVAKLDKPEEDSVLVAEALLDARRRRTAKLLTTWGCKS